MSSILRYLSAFIFSALILTLGFIAYDLQSLGFMVLVAILLGITLYVWLRPSSGSYRFLYPGMLCFFLFTIAPIFFTVLISFTNLGTGHFFSQNEAKEIILSEKIITNDAIEVKYEVYQRGSDIILKAGNQYALIAKKQINTNDLIEFTNHASLEKSELEGPLNFAKVYEFHEGFKSLRFLYDGHTLHYHRVDLLIESKERYAFNQSEESITDLESGLKFYPNEEKGLYLPKDSSASLLPGFYTFIGARNYIDLFSKDDFKQTFMKVSLWTLIWALSSVILTFSLGMSLAIFLNDKNLKGKSIYRNLLILPYSIPFFISVLVFKGMLSKDFGIINSTLAHFGIGAIPWLEDALWAKVSCLLVNLWLGFPYMFLLTTGTLQSIPQSVYEAAKIDGANKWQSFKSITFPMILSSITPLLIGSFAFNLGNFVGIYLLTGGGPAMMGTTTPAGETDILISYTYRLAFEGASGQMFGLASSIALFIFVIITILTLINFRLFNMNKTSEAK